MASRFFTIGSTLLLLATLATAQLSFRNDPSQNSFQIRTPGFQQSFTRYFNGQQGNLLAAQQQSQPQYAPLPHQQQQANSAYSYHGQQYQQQQQQQAQQPYSRFTSQFGAATAANGEPQYTTVQDNYINPNIRLAIEQQRLLQQQQQQQQQYQPQVQQQQQQQQQQPQQQPQQQYYSQEDITAYLQSQQAAQAQYYAQQQPQANPQSQYEYVQQQQQLQQQQQQQQHDATQQQQQQQQQPQQDPTADAAQATHNKLIGVAFSPSNEVSQVKFNGNGLKYNF